MISFNSGPNFICLGVCVCSTYVFVCVFVCVFVFAINVLYLNVERQMWRCLFWVTCLEIVHDVWSDSAIAWKQLCDFFF